MGMIHESTSRLSCEFIRECFTRLDRILCDVGHAIHRVGNFDSMPVDRCWVRQFILHHDPHLVAFGDADHGPGHCSVISKRRHRYAIENRPLYGFRCQLKNFHAVFLAISQRLSALCFGGGLNVWSRDRFHTMAHLRITRRHTAWRGSHTCTCARCKCH